MIDELLHFVAPHLCSGCGRVGSLLCDDCKSYIIQRPLRGCVVCLNTSRDGVCASHHLPYTKAWVVGERRDTLQRLVGSFKFQHARAGARILAELLHERIPLLPQETIVVPVPTISSHVRERGYDHTRLIAEHFAKRRHLPVELVIKHQGTSVQKKANKKTRALQAQHAFSLSKPVKDVPYLIIDDVITTGATIEYASELLKQAGAAAIWVGAIARQPLD